MGIFDRVGKVISSNVNALLDKAEDEKKLVELHLEEMEEQLRRGRQDVVSALASEKQLRTKGAALLAEADKWDKRAELALKGGDEALAREALKQKQRVLKEHDLIEKARAEQGAQALSMKEELARMEAKLEEYKMRKSSIATRAEQAKAGGGAETLGQRGGSSAFENFRRMEDRIEGREAATSAMAEVEEALGHGPPDLEARFRELEGGAAKGGASSPEVEDELAALKKRIRVQ